MSISLEPNKGLRLKLGRFSAIRTWHGGGNFWSHEFQLTVRSGALAGFLPRATEDEDSVLFEYRGGGTEQASTSTAISSMSEIPAKELKALRAAVDELKKKAEDPHCDRTKRQMIEGFRLPDPQKDRDLYRLIGKGSSAKLIVLWGIEREEGSALAPGAAVDLMHTPAGDAEEAAPAKKSSKLVPVLLLLALLGGGGWFYWQQEQEKKRQAAIAAALAEAEALAAAQKAEQDRIAAFNASASSTSSSPSNTASAPSGTTPTASTMPATTAGTDSKKSDSAPKSSGEADPSKKAADMPKSDSGSKSAASTPSTDSSKKSTETPKTASTTPSTTSTPKSSTPTTPAASTTKSSTTSTSAAKPFTAAPGTVVRDSKGSITGIADKDGKFTPALPGTSVSKDGKVTSSSTGSLTRDRSGAVTGIVDKDGKVVSATPGRIITDKDGKLLTGTPGTVVRNGSGTVTGIYGRDGRLVTAVPGTTLDKDGKVIASTPGTVFRDHLGGVTGITGADGKIIDSKPDAWEDRDDLSTSTSSTPIAPAGSVSTPMTTQGPPPAGISSLSVVSTSLSSVLGNGNVEVLLNVVARDTAGAVVNAPQITGWKVNGQLQSKPDGSPADGPVIPVSLPPGTHRISTVGRGSDGQPFQTDADVVVTPK